MTSLIAWTGVDQRGTASIYVASDSRITWPGIGAWDHGRKLFLSREHPHLLGYCGDVLFPTQILSQITEMIDLGAWSAFTGDVDACSKKIHSLIESSFHTYPAAVAQPFQVIYATRTGEGMAAQFHLRLLPFGSSTAKPEVIPLPERSGLAVVLGSGIGAVKSQLEKWNASDVGGTSRAVFAAFSDALLSKQDKATGGPPQLVGLYRRGGGRNFGIIWEGQRFFYGSPVESFDEMHEIGWHNSLFEICDPATLERKPTAQPQPRPRG